MGLERSRAEAGVATSGWAGALPSGLALQRKVRDAWRTRRHNLSGTPIKIVIERRQRLRDVHPRPLAHAGIKPECQPWQGPGAVGTVQTMPAASTADVARFSIAQLQAMCRRCKSLRPYLNALPQDQRGWRL